MPIKPSESEEEYFARQQFEKRKMEAEARTRSMAEEERRRQKELHWMRCPKCGSELAEVEYRSIKIDRCTHCGGTWLDFGELAAIHPEERAGVLAGFGRIFGLGKGD